MKYLVDEKSTLLEAAGAMAPESSKTKLKEWIRDKRVLLNGKPCSNVIQEVSPGTTISLGERKKWLAGDISVLYQDRHFIVIDKPAGLLSVATDSESKATAHAVIKDHFFPRKIGVVHRLDQGTSGVMLFALSDEGLAGLKNIFEAHDILRVYVALVEGRLDGEEGTWNFPLEEDAFYRVHVSENGENAMTHWNLMVQKPTHARLRLELETGKKNQIRVHAAHVGHPIVGDKKYGARTNPLHRLALHAQALGFKHPITGKELFFTSEVPF